MQDAKHLARGCEATENARGVRGHALRNLKKIENAKYLCDFLPFSLIFNTSSKVNYILNNNILHFKVSCVDIINLYFYWGL